MIALLVGFVLAYACLYGWGVADGLSWLQYQRSDIGWLGASIVVVPVLSAWIAAELGHLARPRRLFDGRIRARGARFALGLAAGVVGSALAVPLLPLADRFVPDAVIFGGTAAISTAFFVMCLPRLCPGHCVFCGYDLRDSPGPGRPGFGRCPECGAEFIPRSSSAAIARAPDPVVP